MPDRMFCFSFDGPHFIVRVQNELVWSTKVEVLLMTNNIIVMPCFEHMIVLLVD